MQMIPKISWPHRVASDAVARDEIAPVVLVVTVSSIPRICCWRGSEISGLDSASYPFNPSALTSAFHQRTGNTACDLVFPVSPPHSVASTVEQPSPAAKQPTPPRCNASVDRDHCSGKLHAALRKTRFPDLQPNDRDAMTHPRCASQQ